MALPDYSKPIRGEVLIIRIGLTAQSQTNTFLTAPTIAAGDVKISKDGGALTNLATLPSVDPAGSKVLKITLSATEMDCDEFVLVGSDQAGSEWKDFMVSSGTQPPTAPTLVRTTIATLASQTSFTLTAGSADNDAYNGCFLIVEDATTAVQKCVAFISDYVGSTRTVTLLSDPAIFTMAVGDRVLVIGQNLTGTTVAAVAELSAAQAEPGQGAPAANASVLTKISYLFKAWRNKKTQTATQYSLFGDDAATVDQKATVSDDGTTTTIGEVATGP